MGKVGNKNNRIGENKTGEEDKFNRIDKDRNFVFIN